MSFFQYRTTYLYCLTRNSYFASFVNAQIHHFPTPLPSRYSDTIFVEILKNFYSTSNLTDNSFLKDTVCTFLLDADQHLIVDLFFLKRSKYNSTPYGHFV